jgi:hypothetical protein
MHFLEMASSTPTPDPWDQPEFKDLLKRETKGHKQPEKKHKRKGTE